MSEFDLSQLVEATKPQAHKRRRRPKHFRTLRRVARHFRRQDWLLIFVAVAGFGLAVFVGGLVLTVDARNQVDKSWHGVERVLDNINTKPGVELTRGDFELLQISIADFKQSLASAKTRTRFLQPMDFLSSDLATSLQTLDAAYELSLAADQLLIGLEPAIFYLADGDETETVTPAFSSGHRIVELLNLGRTSFLSAEKHLVTAQAIIDSISLVEASPDLFISVDQLSSFHTMLSDYTFLVLDSPQLLTVMLGLETPQTYLVLSQNSDELRPSGGYISTYGWIKVRKGRIDDYFYGPTTETTPNPPSDDSALPFTVPDWWIQYDKPVYAAWDASWYADFPTTAQLAAWYFDNGGNLNDPVDGVISIDIVGFELILEGLGTVTVPDYGETVTGENFRDVVYRIRAAGTGEREHKEFLAALYYQILTDWQDAEQDKSASLRRAVLQALQEKHIMIYFAEDSLNDAMNTLGWSGRQESATDHDYLMVADANINGSKHNRSIIRELTYDVTIQTDGSLESRLAVAYDYSARTAENDPGIQPEHYSDIDYYGNHQVFVPVGSQLRETSDLQHDPTVVSAETHTSFVALFHLAYDATERFQYVYTSPALVEKIGPYHRYTLLLQKQPGMISEMVNVQVMLPEHASTVHISPDPAASYSLPQPILEFRVNLTHDTWIEVVYTE